MSLANSLISFLDPYMLSQQKSLSDFLVSTDPKEIYVLIGKSLYDLWRPSIINLSQSHLGFLQKVIASGINSTVSYVKFLEYWDKHFVCESDLFHPSSSYKKPPKYTPVSSAMANSTLKTPKLRENPLVPNSTATSYLVSSPKMVWPDPAASFSDVGSAHSCRSSSRHQAYIPPHARTELGSKQTPCRSGALPRLLDVQRKE